MQLDQTQLASLPSRYRAALINGLPGFKPAVLVGTRSALGQDNLAIISSLFHVGASPPLLGMILRPSPAGTERHTLDNILDTGEYTLNGVHRDFARQAHHTAARHPRGVSEFEACGFSPLRIDDFKAPFVRQSPLQIGCRLREHQLLTINQTHLLIGEITHITVPDDCVRSDGSCDLTAMGLLSVTGLDSYHRVEAGQRFTYPKPESAPEPL